MLVGIGEVNYAPRIGLPLMGNYRDDYAAQGVHDPLCSRALVLEDPGSQKVALLSVDICMLDHANVALIRQSIASRCAIEPSNVLVAATHTHSAPATMRLGSLPKADDAEIAQILAAAAGAVVLADRDLHEATLRIGSIEESRLSFNRRLLCRDGRTHMNWEGLDPDFVVRALGPVDPIVTALAVGQDDHVRSVAVNFALHPAVLAGDNWLYSADYPGSLTAALSRLLGQDLVTLFFNGCCGNVNHLDYRDPLQGRGFKMTERIGSMLAIDVFQAIQASAPVAGDRVAVSREYVALKRLPISEEERRWCEEILDRRHSRPAPGQVDGLPDDYWAATRLGMYEKQTSDDSVEVMAVRIGDTAVVGLPGEMFAEYGIEIRSSSPASHTMVIELANGAIGYIPTQQAFEEGGYEPTPGATFYTADCGRRLVESALQQLQALFQD